MGQSVSQEQKDTALKNDTVKGDLESVKYHVQNGADIYFNSCIVLHQAAINNHVDILEFLMNTGTDAKFQAAIEPLKLEINYKDLLLLYATTNNHWQTAKFLLTKGADPTADNYNTFIRAAGNKNEDIIQLFTDHIQGMNKELPSDNILVYGAVNKHFNAVNTLLREGRVNPNFINEIDNEIKLAKKNNQLDVITLLNEFKYLVI